MIVSFYPNERTLVNDFVSFTFSRRVPLSNGETRRLFIWGYEVWLPEGKNQTKSGSIDLIGTDENGEVWLIEAKLCTNPELNLDIWRKQIDPYRISLSKREESQIAMGARRFLIGESSGAVKPTYLLGVTGLYEAFQRWCKFWEMGELQANMLYDRTIKNIQEGRMISTVLSDVADENVWNSRQSSFSNGGYAYIIFNSSQIHVGLDYHSDHLWIVDEDFSRATWAQFLKKKRDIKPTPSTVELYLADEVIDIYHKILETLKGLGWNGKAKPNTKAFVIDFPTIYGVDLRIHIGWVDADGSLDIKYRTPYTYGLKFNIDFRHFKQRPEMKGIWYPLARRLMKEANYNGRGKAEAFNKRELYEWEYESWDGEMYRMVDKYNRDYIGRPEEEKDLESALSILKEIIINQIEKPAKTKKNPFVDLDFFS